jgi:tetraacyldisaccharide 4'-kinase
VKTPFFWYQSKGFYSTILSPLSWLYEKGAKIHRTWSKPQKFSVPLLSVGNITSGGAGKTPTAIALGDLLQKKGFKIHFVTRGYGGKIAGPLKVDPSVHQASMVGDEPLLLAQKAPTWVAKDRRQGVQKAIEDGAEVIILDDAHQTHRLFKDVSFVVVDLMQGFGNECVIPAGPLRENLEDGLERADAFIGIGEKVDNKLSGKLVFRAKSIFQPVSFPSNRIIAFCGLGFPQKFYKSLEKEGLTLLATESFPDHYVYKEKDLIDLQFLAKKHQAILVTTRKDWVKIPPSWHPNIYVLDLEIQFEDLERVFRFILDKVPALEKRG